MSNYENAPATALLATRCAICNRKLVDSVSVECGVGPECREKYNVGRGPDGMTNLSEALVRLDAAMVEGSGWEPGPDAQKALASARDVGNDRRPVDVQGICNAALHAVACAPTEYSRTLLFIEAIWYLGFHMLAWRMTIRIRAFINARIAEAERIAAEVARKAAGVVDGTVTVTYQGNVMTLETGKMTREVFAGFLKALRACKTRSYNELARTNSLATSEKASFLCALYLALPVGASLEIRSEKGSLLVRGGDQIPAAYLRAAESSLAPAVPSVIYKACPRCTGSGRLARYNHVKRGVCFLCNGRKRVAA